MLTLPHIAISTAGFQTGSLSDAPNPRAIIDAIASTSTRAIALDATHPGLRPRTLSRSARRDLAATLRRSELTFVGLDLWIPPEHFTDRAHAHRAIEALTQACELSAELASLVGSAGSAKTAAGGQSRPVVSTMLPSELALSDRQALDAAAQSLGAIIADHHPEPTPLETHSTDLIAGLAIGIDPALILMNGQSPGKAITHAGKALASARLNDVNAMGRCAVGAPGSKLDLTSYAGALIVAGHQWVTLDVRDMPDPILAIQRAQHAWAQAGSL
tara:strand:- start:207082 stop:207900 length:819 start_codon:yes stop_codon:yes gene_type:complete